MTEPAESGKVPRFMQQAHPDETPNASCARGAGERELRRRLTPLVALHAAFGRRVLNVKTANIVIMNPDADLGSNPTLGNLVGRLAGDGFHLDLLSPTPRGRPPIAMARGSITHHPYPFGNSPSAIWARINAWRLISRGVTSAVLAVNPRGVSDAYPACKLAGKPLVYVSFEMLFRDELPKKQGWRRGWTRLKNAESRGSRAASLVVIQDPVRGRLLREENGLANPRFFYMPVAPGTNPPSPDGAPDRESFGLPKGKVIALHSGSFGDWTHGEALLRSAQTWPDEFLLLVHLSATPNSEVKRLIAGCTSPKVIFSTEPLAEKGYQELIHCADIGLVLYKPGKGSPWTGRNIEAMGMASGKFASYMKAGLPTVTLRMPFHRKVLEEYGYGIDIDEFQELPDALTAIRRAPGPYGAEARRLFEERLNFDLHYPELKRRLLDLANRPNEDRR